METKSALSSKKHCDAEQMEMNYCVISYLNLLLQTQLKPASRIRLVPSISNYYRGLKLEMIVIYVSSFKY
jgi:hypothetical protein